MNSRIIHITGAQKLQIKELAKALLREMDKAINYSDAIAGVLAAKYDPKDEASSHYFEQKRYMGNFMASLQSCAVLLQEDDLDIDAGPALETLREIAAGPDGLAPETLYPTEPTTRLLRKVMNVAKHAVVDHPDDFAEHDRTFVEAGAEGYEASLRTIEKLAQQAKRLHAQLSSGKTHGQ